MVLYYLQEQPTFDKKQFVTYMKRYIKNLAAKLDPEQQVVFKKHIEGATKYLLSKLSDLQLYVLPIPKVFIIVQNYSFFLLSFVGRLLIS
jgi:hypothetical protein